MKKIVFLLIIVMGFAFAQPPGDLLPIFPAPLDDVLVPWTDVERVDDALCWPGEPPPFIGAAYTFACFHSPLSRRYVTQGLDAAFGDAGYWLNPVPRIGAGPSLTRAILPGGSSNANKVEIHVFDHAESGTLFSVAAAF